MKKKSIVKNKHNNIHSNMQSTPCMKKFEEAKPFLFTNELGFIVEFVYRDKFYCFHLESNCLNGPDDGYWDWWYEFDKYGNPAKSSIGEGNLSFEIRGGYLGNQPAMISLEINVYHDGVYIQNEQVVKFNVLEISRKKCYA